MSHKLRFALWVGLLTLFVVGLFAAFGAALWADLDPAQRDALRAMVLARPTLPVLFFLLLPFVLGGLLKWAMAAYPVAAARLAEEVTLIHTVNPEHRVTPDGGPELRRLATAVNAFAEAHSGLHKQVQSRIEEANLRIEEEKNRLAALMAELAQSVLVCNREGRILLYNARAAQLLEGADADPDAAPVGLGRSIFGLLDKSQIVHALEKIGRRLEQHGTQPGAHFVTARGDQLLRAQMAPVLDREGAVGGFVLMLEDITRSIETDSRRNFLLQQLTEGTRASLANIRAAAETVQQYPDMDAERRQRFTEVIRDEAEQLSARLDATLAHDDQALGTQWPLEDMLATDLVYALQRNFEGGLGVVATMQGDEEPFWLSVDSHALVQALTQVMGRIVSTFGTRAVRLELTGAGRFVRLSLLWNGPALSPDTLRDWEEQPFSLGAGGHVATLKQVLDRHGAEMWSQADRAAGANRLCLQLPAARPGRVAAGPAVVPGRPVYYDFDLFSQAGQTPELDERKLIDLTCTVFDTETTGLSPSDGDEIISIGAVRIVNGRLLKQECFDRLVRPRRPVRRESEKIHGISAQMLAGQPVIEQVLPMFRRFAEDTVLVAHNAAFDMRFLQLAREQTGVEFDQPVLDTLMLSALAHPGRADDEHRLEQIAARLGIPVIGRHTALGDAIVTGEVFLKLIPLLAERGIHTLKQARDASQQTLYAKLEY
ncbi:3'-5' exonuclease [Piscinibacter sp.]|uniref:3'-5' exonuclease n=1 Tax=Piscinibacter sp. TaxID=1903157 RepID=UPI002BA6F791|nr:exonuclease domain-containing protein [Albitalea sp.]HUG26382.1 exonuclease domain-containing protein [Albitalea sp.]